MAEYWSSPWPDWPVHYESADVTTDPPDPTQCSQRLLGGTVACSQFAVPIYQTHEKSKEIAVAHLRDDSRFTDRHENALHDAVAADL